MVSSFLRKTKHETNHLFLQSKSLRRLKKWLAHRSPRCPKSSSWNVLSPRAQMSSATWDTTGYSSSLCRRLRSARGCSICQPVYALDIFKYINGPSLLPTGNWITSFVTTIPQKVLQLSKSALHSSLLPSSKSLNSKECKTKMKATEQCFPRAGTGEMKNNLFEKQSYTPAAQATTEILLLCLWHLSENKI